MKQLFTLKIFIFTYFICTVATNITAKNHSTYDGIVVPIFKADINAGSDANYWGSLNFAARLGQITNPGITNMQGKEIQSATVLSSMRKQYWKGQVMTAKGELVASQKNLKVAKENDLRYKKLYPTGAAPIRTYQEMRATYYEAIGRYETAKAILFERERVYDQCIQSAPIEGLVDKVYYTRGILTSDPKVLQLEELNPIGVKVKMSADQAAKINISIPVSIHIEGKSDPIGIYNGYSLFCDDGIIFTTRNTPQRYADVTQVEECLPIVNFYIGNKYNNKLAIPTPTLHKDKNGYYVWKAVDRKTMQAGKGLNPVFKIEMVRVVPGKLKRIYNGITDMQILKDPGKLELHDLVVTAPGKKLKNGETVCLPPSQYILMPGDNVKVNIGLVEDDTTVSENIKELPATTNLTPIDIRSKIGHHVR